MRAKCSLYSILREREALGYWLRAYCESDFARCARHEAMLGGAIVSTSLLPNGRHVGVDDDVPDSG